MSGERKNYSVSIRGITLEEPEEPLTAHTRGPYLEAMKGNIPIKHEIANQIRLLDPMATFESLDVTLEYFSVETTPEVIDKIRQHPKVELVEDKGSFATMKRSQQT